MEPKLTLEVDATAELAAKADMPVEELTTLKEAFRTLESQVAEKTFGNGVSPLGAEGNYQGVPIQEAGMLRSACAKMKWAHQNSGLRYMPFFKLDYENPIQGIEIYKEGVLIDTIVVPITGGMDGDPTKQISYDMYTMIAMLLQHANEQSQK